MADKRQSIPFKLRVLRFKNSDFFNFVHAIIYKLKPPKKYNGIPKKILLFRNDKIGDAVVTMPVLRDLKLNYPDLEIHILMSETNSFVLENISYIDKIIQYKNKDFIGRVVIFDADSEDRSSFKRILNKIFRLFIIGHILQFTFFSFLPYIFRKSFRSEIQKFKDEKYDAVIDLSGSKRLAILSRLIGHYTVGPRIFGFAWLYSYYLDLNWVTAKDTDFMSRKIENMFKEALNFQFIKRNKTLPFSENVVVTDYEKDHDIFFHIGTSELRKLTPEQENKLIEGLVDYKIFITDSADTERFKFYKEKYSGKPNFTFKLYDNLRDISHDAAKSRLLLCYDGGQAHFLSQYTKSFTIFGPVSFHLWKPYEFEDYELIKTFDNGLEVIKSKGQLGHVAVYIPIWCRPCFDVGCKTRPCIVNLNIESILETIKESIN